MATVSRVTRRMVNATKRKNAPARKGRQNPLAALVGYTNPKKKGSKKTMAATKKNIPRAKPRAKPAKPKSAAKRKSTAKPQIKYRTRTVEAPRRPNAPRRRPAILAGPAETIRLGALALAGFVATRQVPQLILGSRNAGILGYITNFATAAIAATAGRQFLDKESAAAVGIGGALYLVERVLNEQFTPIGKALSLSGLGDVRAVTSLKGVRPAYVPFPVQYDAQGQPVIPPQIDAARAIAAVQAAAVPAAAVPVPANNGARFNGRF